MKHCSKCGDVQPLSSFNKHRHTRDGLSNHCKECRRLVRHEYHKARTRLCAKSECNNKATSNAEDAVCFKHRTNRAGRWLARRVSYKGAHYRVKYSRGKASEHQCLDCGAQANEWSYRGGSASELTEIRPEARVITHIAYSPDPDDYDPRCTKCHRSYDRDSYLTSNGAK